MPLTAPASQQVHPKRIGSLIETRILWSGTTGEIALSAKIYILITLILAMASFVVVLVVIQPFEPGDVDSSPETLGEQSQDPSVIITVEKNGFEEEQQGVG